MPEGDTIHTIAAALRPRLLGQPIEQIEVDLSSKDWLIGASVVEVQARGKHLLITLRPRHSTEGAPPEDCVLRTHLGLHGNWHRYSPGEGFRRPSWQCSLRIDTHRDVFVCFNAREVALLSSERTRLHRPLRRLGPDLVAKDVDWRDIIERARRLPPGTPMATVLLDQSVASGIGNVYKSEVCFLERHRPHRPLATFDDDDLIQLFRRAGALLRSNVGRRARRTTGSSGLESNLWVYGRSSQPCLLCRTPIQYARLGRDRSTYWCPRCQPPLPAGPAGSEL